MIETIHKKFCELTGVEKLTLSALRMQIWSDFISRGFTEADLELVVMWIKRQIPRGSGFSNLSLQFSTFFKNGVDTFEERLALAKLKRRPICEPVKPSAPAPQPSPGDDALRERGRVLLGKFKKELRP